MKMCGNGGEQGRNRQYYKYGIYVTRTLAVKHPEMYLKVDGLFVEIG